MPKVILLAPHTHGGAQYKKGDVIDVSERQAAWLKERGIIDTNPAPEQSAAVADSKPQPEIQDPAPAAVVETEIKKKDK